MKLVPSELDIDVGRGFTAENDRFQLKGFGDRLTNLVRSLDTPFVLVLDAPWGSGKTIFVKTWIEEYAKKSERPIYIDAFSEDYQQDAFMTIVSRLLEELKNKSTPESDISIFKDKAVSVAKILARSGVKIAIKAATLGVISAEGLEKDAAEIAKAVGEEAGAKLDDVIRTRLEGHAEEINAFASFRDSLAELAASNDGPLVIVIDELDRCRPNFAMEMIEKLKHFFSVSGVFFILVTNLNQLENYAKSIYGNIDAHAYLEKFYQLRLRLPRKSTNGRNDYQAEFAQSLGIDSQAANLIGQYARAADVPLRTISRIASYWKIAKISAGKSHFDHVIGMVLCILRVHNPALFDSISEVGFDKEEFLGRMQFSNWREVYDSSETSRLGKMCASTWNVLLDIRDESENGVRAASMLRNSGLTKKELIAYYCDFIDGFRLPGYEQATLNLPD